MQATLQLFTLHSPLSTLYSPPSLEQGGLRPAAQGGVALRKLQLKIVSSGLQTAARSTANPTKPIARVAKLLVRVAQKLC